MHFRSKETDNCVIAILLTVTSFNSDDHFCFYKGTHLFFKHYNSFIKAGFHMIASIAEKKKSSATLAIIWKPLSSDRERQRSLR